MSKLAQVNVAIGFIVIFIAASAGSFIAFDLAENFLKDPELISSWAATLQRSAHGHFNMFGMLHILFGLSLHYSKLGTSVKRWQTIGLFLGTIAMGPVMLIRSYSGPSTTIDFLTVIMGSFLSLALAVLAMHIYGIFLKMTRY